MRWLSFAAVTCFAGAAWGAAQTGNLLPNPSFEEGKNSPAGWRLQGKGEWASPGRTGRRCVVVDGSGKGSEFWRCALPKLSPGRPYRVTFWMKALGAGAGGCVVSGPSCANSDFPFSADWTRRSFVFVAPKAPKDAYVRFGVWNHRGRVAFDDVALAEVSPLHRAWGDLTLGAGESVRGARYEFAAALNRRVGGFARPLAETTAGFNSSRWVFGPGAYVVYRHEIGRARQTSAEVEVRIGYYVRGACLVECSRDGRRWRRLGRLTGVGKKRFSLPRDLFPAKAVWVRLRSPGASEAREDSAPGAFQVHGYAYRARLDASFPNREGSTRFLDVERLDPRLRVRVLSLGDLLPSSGQRVRLQVANRSGRRLEAVVEVLAAKSGEKLQRIGGPARVALGPEQTRPVSLPYALTSAGDYTLRIQAAAAGRPAFAASTEFSVPSLYDSSYGYWLGSNSALEWWWCESTYKVGRTRPAPARSTRRTTRIDAARGEYEPIQIVLRPKRDLRRVRLRVLSDEPTWRKAAQIDLVYYHYVHRPTDSAGCVGWWPDALPPYRGPFDLKAGRNQPVWLLVKIPRDAAPGEHRLALRVDADGAASVTTPVVVRVFDFAIPKTPHVESGFGLSAGRIWQYHNLKTEAQKRRVWDLYMQSFREHRISPYDFAPLDPIAAEFTGVNWQGGEVETEGAASGKRCLKIVDNDPKSAVSCHAAHLIPVQPGARYRFGWSVRTARPGQPYLVTLTTYDAGRRWISGHNIDLNERGDVKWRRVEHSLVPTKRSPAARFVRVVLRATPWSSTGADIGTAWFDDISFVKEGTTRNLVSDPGFEADASDIRARVDFRAWDRQARRYLDGYGFTAFRLPLKGLGGGTFYARREGRIGPFQQGTPEYRRVFREYCMTLQNHLAARGWLKKAYIYWFDEPAPRDYPFVRAGMEEIKRAGPKLRRMLTEEPVEPLFGAVDLWCPVLHRYDPEACHARQRLGEQIWWYVCTGPKSPYPTLFIDHNAINLRIWLWMTWKWNVQGILVWSSNYWTSSCAFPRPKLQNPWEDPMGYVQGYGRPPGFIGYWGNGDGRFLYPPNRDVERDRRPYVEGPVSSIRWEMLREGLEDYEYFWLLRDAVNQARRAGAPAGEIAAAEKLLSIPPAIIQDKTHFTRDPQPLFARRRALAQAIERLRRLSRGRRPAMNAQKQTITVTVKAPDSAWRLHIEEVRRVGDELWVVASLTRPPGMGAQVITTLTDRVEVTAPALPVRYFVIRNRPGRTEEGAYTFVQKRGDIPAELEQGEVLFRR